MSIPQSGGGPIESHADLAGYLEAGCKPAERFRIGTEHEKFGYCLDTLKPLPYDGPRSILAMLEGMRDRFDWVPVEEGGRLIGLKKGGANISARCTRSPMRSGRGSSGWARHPSGRMRTCR